MHSLVHLINCLSAITWQEINAFKHLDSGEDDFLKFKPSIKMGKKLTLNLMWLLVPDGLVWVSILETGSILYSVFALTPCCKVFVSFPGRGTGGTTWGWCWTNGCCIQRTLPSMEVLSMRWSQTLPRRSNICASAVHREISSLMWPMSFIYFH